MISGLPRGRQVREGCAVAGNPHKPAPPLFSCHVRGRHFHVDQVFTMLVICVAGRPGYGLQGHRPKARRPLGPGGRDDAGVGHALISLRSNCRQLSYAHARPAIGPWAHEARGLQGRRCRTARRYGHRTASLALRRMRPFRVRHLLTCHACGRRPAGCRRCWTQQVVTPRSDMIALGSAAYT
jgi:hypothetical protein